MTRMEELYQRLLMEVRGIMQGKNAPNSIPINSSIVMLKGGNLYEGKHEIRESETELKVSAADLRKALATLKSRQIEHSQKRIDSLQRRQELDKKLLELLREYED